MTDNSQPDHVTIIKERGSSGGGMMVAVLAIVLIAIAAFYLLSNRTDPSSKDASITAAANKVGNAADKVGNAAEDAVKKVN